MKHFFRLFIFFGLFSLALQSKSQDKLIFRNTPDTLLVKVIEVGVDKISYRLWPVSEDLPLIEERIGRLTKIIFSNGKQLKCYEDGFSDPINYVNQRKMAVKIAPFGLLVAQTSISVEKSIKPGRSFEYSIQAIGAGLNFEGLGEPIGLTVRSGYKYINTPDFQIDGMRYMHILKGSYIKPEVIGTYYSILKNDFMGLAGMMNFGKQWVFSDAMCVDLYTGIGLGFKKQLSNEGYSSFVSDAGIVVPYGFALLPTAVSGKQFSGFGMCLNIGLRVGFLL